MYISSAGAEGRTEGLPDGVGGRGRPDGSADGRADGRRTEGVGLGDPPKIIIFGLFCYIFDTREFSKTI